LVTIYLDQNKWIELARAFNGRHDGEQFKETLNLAFMSVDAGRAKFPLSSAHYMEVSKDGNAERRRRLATFMVELSERRSMISSPALMRSLVVAGLCQLLGRPNELGEPPVFGRGLNWVFGEHLLSATERFSYPFRASMLERYLDSDQETVEVLSDSPTLAHRPEAAALRKEEMKLATHAAVIRDAIAPYGKEARRMSYSGSLFSSILADFEFALRRLDIPLSQFYADPAEALKLIDFIPPLDIERDLVLGRDFHLDRKPAGNDMLDITAISMAIAYCDIVVTERFWEHIANTTGVAKRYDTLVISDVNGLQQFLRN
jgi:hypothetical protein